MELKLDSTIIDSHIGQNLATEALKVQPILSYCEKLYKDGQMSSSDLAGIFILSYLGLRRHKSWSNGCLKNLISESLSLTSCINSSRPSSVEICSIPGLFDILDENYVKKRILKVYKNSLDEDGIPKITVLSIFDGLQLRGIKNNADDYVNRCLVNWAYGLRPVCLMFRIPSPLEVLLQQSNRSRVITLFLTLEELKRKHISMLYYMDGMQNHAKDSFEFLLHDMKHMENFTDSSIHLEQVGFFRCFLRLSPDLNQSKQSDSSSTKEELNALVPRPNSPKKFFTTVCGYDKLLWRELEYVISDMNCYCTHLMQYVLAKMLFATERLLLTLPCACCGIHESHTDTPFQEPDRIPEINHVPVDEKLKDLEISSTDNRINSEHSDSNSKSQKPCSDKSHTSSQSECQSKRLKDVLSEKWLCLLDLFGMEPWKGIAEQEGPSVRHKHEGDAEGQAEGGGEGQAEGGGEGQGEHKSIYSLPPPSASSRVTAHAAAVGMVDTAFKVRGPLTAEEGAALRLFFSEIGSRS